MPTATCLSPGRRTAWATPATGSAIATKATARRVAGGMVTHEPRARPRMPALTSRASWNAASRNSSRPNRTLRTMALTMGGAERRGRHLSIGPMSAYKYYATESSQTATHPTQT